MAVRDWVSLFPIIPEDCGQSGPAKKQSISNGMKAAVVHKLGQPLVMEELPVSWNAAEG